jgi:hypothetical protein
MGTMIRNITIVASYTCFLFGIWSTLTGTITLDNGLGDLTETTLILFVATLDALLFYAGWLIIHMARSRTGQNRTALLQIPPIAIFLTLGLSLVGSRSMGDWDSVLRALPAFIAAGSLLALDRNPLPITKEAPDDGQQ